MEWINLKHHRSYILQVTNAARLGLVTTYLCIALQELHAHEIVFLSRTCSASKRHSLSERFCDWRMYLAFVLGGQLDKITDVCKWSRFGLMLVAGSFARHWKLPTVRNAFWNNPPAEFTREGTMSPLAREYCTMSM